MPRIQQDFSKISSSFQPLPDGEYLCTIEEIEETKSRNGNPMLTFQLSVGDPRFPEHDGYPLYDRLVLTTNEGKPNRPSLGRLKAYAEATLGDEAANAGEIDTDAMKGSQVIVVLSQRSYEVDVKGADGQPTGTKESRVGNDIKKILRVA
jgi:hypothetical protein